jgi:phosphate transport system substrate-binding protein
MTNGSTQNRYAVTRVSYFLSLTLFVLALLLLAVSCRISTSEHASATVTPLLPYAMTPTKAMQTSLCGNNAAFVVAIDGSELIAPVTERIAEKFVTQNPCVRVVIDSNGTSQGFERFCNGEIHMNEAWLWIRDSELCFQNGIKWLKLVIAQEGFGNFVSIRNDFVEYLTGDQNRQIWRPTDAARVWSELDPRWPDKEIHRYAALNERGSPILVNDPSYEDVEGLDHYDAAMIDDLAIDPFGIGFFGTTHYAGNEDRIKPVSLLVDGEHISHNPLVVGPGQYFGKVWVREIYMYVNRQALRDQQALEEFLDFYMTEMPTLAREGGFFALSLEEYEWKRNLIRSSATAP